MKCLKYHRFCKFEILITTLIPHSLPASVLQMLSSGYTSLADELNASRKGSIGSHGHNSHFHHHHSGGTSTSTMLKQNSLLALKCGYLLDEDSSPDSDRLQSLGDVDSGHSTAHSPTDFKSMSPQAPGPGGQEPRSPEATSPFPPPYGGVPFSQLEMLEATHRGLHKFVPRHHDEIEVEIGDPIYVQKEAEDLWCEGVNLRTGRQGIFPSAYAVDLDYNDFDATAVEMKRERYLLGYLGSVETLAHKGTGVVCQAVRKIVGDGTESPKAQACILEISDQGLRMVDRSRVSCATRYKILSLILKLSPAEQKGQTALHRLLLLAEERLVLCVPPAGSPLHRLHHQTSDGAAVRVPRVPGHRIDPAGGGSRRVRSLKVFLGVFEIYLIF